MLYENEDGEIQGDIPDIPDSPEAKQDYAEGVKDGSTGKEPRKLNNGLYIKGYRTGKKLPL